MSCAVFYTDLYASPIKKSVYTLSEARLVFTSGTSWDNNYCKSSVAQYVEHGFFCEITTAMSQPKGSCVQQTFKKLSASLKQEGSASAVEHGCSDKRR